jgi:hypothetical protein
MSSRESVADGRLIDYKVGRSRMFNMLISYNVKLVCIDLPYVNIAPAATTKIAAKCGA